MATLTKTIGSLNNYIQANRLNRGECPFTAKVHCADGFSMSVQANFGSYCKPRNNEGPYSEVEVGYPSKADPMLLPYMEMGGNDNPTDTVYPYVPVEVVEQVIQIHGGYYRNRWHSFLIKFLALIG